MSADAHWEEKNKNKQESPKSLLAPRPLGGNPSGRLRHPRKEGSSHLVGLSQSPVSLWSPYRASFMLTAEPQHGRAVAGPSGKRVGSQQTSVLAPALPFLAV